MGARRQRLSRVRNGTCRQEARKDHEDMGLDAMLDTVIDRPQLEIVFQVLNAASTSVN